MTAGGRVQISVTDFDVDEVGDLSEGVTQRRHFLAVFC